MKWEMLDEKARSSRNIKPESRARYRLHIFDRTSAFGMITSLSRAVRAHVPRDARGKPMFMILRAALLALGLAGAQAAQADDFPSKPHRRK
jgi:hypothetical protein